MLSLEKIYHARYVLKDVIRKTDLIHAPKIKPGTQVYLKTENLQKTGSFKIRGAYYKISQLSDEEKKRGVIACSAGNHAQGVALAARANNIPAVICLPDGAPISKVEATRSYGAEICLVPGVYDDAYNKAIELQEKHGYTFIHPFNDELVIAGQGTIGLEILDQIEDAEAVVVPVGGGGLISGVAYAIKTLRPDIKVYGVQSAGAPSMARSLNEDKIVSLEHVQTVADGIQVKAPGDLTFDICSKYVDEIVTVSDDEVATAILALMEQQKLITEGAGAVSVAAVMFDKIPRHDKVVCILSGGNIDVTILSKVIERGLLTSGRSDTLSIQLEDKPGQLSRVSEILADLKANVVSVQYEKASEGASITACVLRLNVETRNFEHIRQVHQALYDNGFTLIHP
jgi:threonine dehydratase